MRARLTSTALAALALGAAAPAVAQEPDLTPVPRAAQETEAQSAASASDIGLPVFRQFRRDGEIDPCAHSLRRLERTRDEVPATRAERYPDFLPAVEAAIEEREQLTDAECERVADAEKAEQERASEGAEAKAKPTPTPTPTPTATPTPTPTAAPTATATPAPAATATPAPPPAPAPAPVPAAPSLDDSPAAPEDPVEPDASAPALPEIAPEPAPAPSVVPPPPPAPAPAEPTIVNRRDPDGPTPVLLGAILGGPFALLGLLGLVLATLGKFGLAEEPRARLRHAWGEAAFRAGSAWGDFTDWLRFGR